MYEWAVFWEEKTNDGEAFKRHKCHSDSWRQTRVIPPPLSTWTDASVYAWVKMKRAASLQGFICCIYRQTTTLSDDFSSHNGFNPDVVFKAEN